MNLPKESHLMSFNQQKSSEPTSIFFCLSLQGNYRQKHVFDFNFNIDKGIKEFYAKKNSTFISSLDIKSPTPSSHPIQLILFKQNK